MPANLALLPFQRRFIRSAMSPGIRTAALSLPRGSGKSSLAADILRRCLTPGDPLHVEGAEFGLCAASIEGARYVYRPLRAALEEALPGAFSFTDSMRALGIRHKATGTRLRVMSSNARSAMGAGAFSPVIVGDEPGSWEQTGGRLMAETLLTSQGKPGCSMRLLLLGTLAPAMGGWWPELVNGGSVGSTHVTALSGDPERWDQASEIRRVNPLMWRFPESRKVLLDERDAARRDSRLKAAFLSYRLNSPARDEAECLLEPEDLRAIGRRPRLAPEGAPVLGLDLGASRSWSAAAAIFNNGGLDAMCLAPGIPSLDKQERRDGVERGTYRALVEAGALTVADGWHVPPIEMLWSAILRKWGPPALVVCDRFRLPELADATGGAVRIEPRVSRWSESTADIQALRSLAKDGPLSIANAATLDGVAHALASADVANDDAGNVRLTKRGQNSTGRDDLAAALTLAAGAWKRQRRHAAPIEIIHIDY